MATMNVPIRLERHEAAFYGRVAKAAGTDLNTVLCVLLALSLANRPAKQTRKSAKS